MKSRANKRSSVPAYLPNRVADANESWVNFILFGIATILVVFGATLIIKSAGILLGIFAFSIILLPRKVTDTLGTIFAVATVLGIFYLLLFC